MAYWLGDSDSAHTVDRVMQETLGIKSNNNGPPFQDLCSTIVPKCLLGESLRSSSSSSSQQQRRLNPVGDDDAAVSATRNEITWS
jgi:hypothetical protein